MNVAPRRIAMTDTTRKTLQRYTYFQRVNHWLIALCFILLALSGLAFFHPSLYWLANILGGGPWTRIWPPFFGVVRFMSFLFFLFVMMCLNWLYPSSRPCFGGL